MRDDARLSYCLHDRQLGWDSRPPCLDPALATLRAAGPRPSRRIRGTGPPAVNAVTPAWICALCWIAVPYPDSGSGGAAHWEATSSSAWTVAWSGRTEGPRRQRLG
ncbi:unnamed protein product [Urochloa humidicola]